MIVYKKTDGTIWQNVTGEIPNGWTDIQPDYSFLKPVWNEYESRWVEGATLEESEKFQRQKELEVSLEFSRKKKADGLEYYEIIDAKLVRLMSGKTEKERNDLDVEYRRKILPYIELVQSGQWWTARRMINNTTLPKMKEIEDLFREVKQAINDYVDNNYPK